MARIAARARREQEESAFAGNMEDFLSLLRGPFFFRRDTESDDPHAFYISKKCGCTAGEIMVYPDPNRLIFRPWNHQEYQRDVMKTNVFAPPLVSASPNRRHRVYLPRVVPVPPGHGKYVKSEGGYPRRFPNPKLRVSGRPPLGSDGKVHITHSREA